MKKINNKFLYVFVLLLIIPFILSYKKANANVFYNLEISGVIDVEENIIVATELRSEGNYLYDKGRFIVGNFTIEYVDYNIAYVESNVKWIYYSGSILYAYGLDLEDDPLYHLITKYIIE